MFPDETLASYVLRVAIANYYHPATILQVYVYGKEKPANLSYISSDKVVRRVSQLTGTSISGLLDGTVHRFSPVITPPDVQIVSREFDEGRVHELLSKNLIKYYIRGARTEQFCPICLSNAPYQRISWLLLPSSVCLEHKCMLIDICMGCGSSILTKSLLLRKCHKCGKDLCASRDAIVQIDELGIKSQKILMAWLLNRTTDSETSLPIQLSCRSRFCLLEAIRTTISKVSGDWTYFHLLGDDHKKALMSMRTKMKYNVTLNHIIYTTAFKALLNWPESFYDFLDHYRYRPDRSSGTHIRDALGYIFFDWIKRYMGDSEFESKHEFDEIKDYFRDYYLRTYRVF
jgi:hypothetical protein